MRAGRLRHRLTLQENNASETTIRPADDWDDVALFYGSVEPLSGTELYRQAQVQPETTHVITVRYNATNAPTTAMRWKLGTRFFNILSVLKTNERNIEFQCMCKEEL